MADDWITLRDAAKLSGYHPEHIRKLMRENRIKGRKVVIVWLVSRKSLDAYLREQAQRGERRGRKPFDTKE
jgi:Helix-turn-helix domain